jgi:DNA polymerase-4
MDECFLDVTGSADVHGSGEEIAQKIRHTVKAELSLTVSVGVSFNKIFAKLGSDLKKPDAVTEITEESFRSQVWPLPVSALFFVGRATSAKLLRYGIKTIGQLTVLPPEFLRQVFGKNGLLLWSYANGLDTAPVMRRDHAAPPKSIGHGITCTVDLEHEEEVWHVLLELSQDIGHKLNAQGLKAVGVQISVKDNALVSRQFQGRLPCSAVSAADIALRARQLFDGNYDWQRPVRALTVRVFDLRAKDEPEQIDLFAELEKRERREQLRGCVEDVRRRFGKRALYSAALMGDIKLPEYRDHELILPGVMKH